MRAGGFPANTVTAGPDAEVGRLQRPGSPWCHRPGPPPRRHHRLVVPDFEGYVHGFTQSPAFGGDPASRLCLSGSQWFGATVGSSSSYVRVLAATWLFGSSAVRSGVRRTAVGRCPLGACARLRACVGEDDGRGGGACRRRSRRASVAVRCRHTASAGRCLSPVL